MEELDELLLLSGNDIPFPEARLNIHQPLIKEIALIGEENFHIGSHFLCFDKNKIINQDKVNSNNQSNFDIFMSVINSKEKVRHRLDGLVVFAMLFPNAKFVLQKDRILLQEKDITTEINANNFDKFQNLVSQIFCLNDNALDEKQKYNPADSLAAKIAEKLKKRDAKKQALAGSNEKANIYSRYISILTVGLKKDMNDYMNYTVYQLRDEYHRFILKSNFDIYVKAKMAGAEDLEEAEDWMKDIHSLSNNN
jgi:hypothetical protein